MRIFINSYTFVYEFHFKMFNFFKNRDVLVFVVPKVWKAKGGKIKVVLPEKKGFKIIRTWAPFYHSHYPVIKGMLKGWMPFTGWIIRKMATPGDVLFSSAEPNLLTTYLYSRLAKKLRLKHVFFTWQNIEYSKRLKGFKLRVTNWLLRQNIKLSAGAICGTRQAYGILKPYLADSRIKSVIIPQMGIDADIFKPGLESDFRKRYSIENKIVFLFCAVFDERKGVFTAINAFKQTLDSRSDCHLVMIGIGKLWESAKALVDELGISKNVDFIKWLPNNELPVIFSAVDVLVYPSEPFKDWEEQYGLTLHEASASGLPVITTDIGAISEAILDKETGILVEPKNVEALAEAMLFLANNPEIRSVMGARGREYILNNFTHKVVAEKIENFLYSL